jgi:hypothetical protein
MRDSYKNRSIFKWSKIYDDLHLILHKMRVTISWHLVSKVYTSRAGEVRERTKYTNSQFSPEIPMNFNSRYFYTCNSYVQSLTSESTIRLQHSIRIKADNSFNCRKYSLQTIIEWSSYLSPFSEVNHIKLCISIHVHMGAVLVDWWAI